MPANNRVLKTILKLPQDLGIRLTECTVLDREVLDNLIKGLRKTSSHVMVRVCGKQGQEDGDRSLYYLRGLILSEEHRHKVKHEVGVGVVRRYLH